MCTIHEVACKRHLISYGAHDLPKWRSTTTRSNRQSLQPKCPGTHVHNISKFQHDRIRNAKVSFWPPHHGHQYPYWCVFRVDLSNHWAKSLAIAGLQPPYMPASSIRVWWCFGENCRSSFFALASGGLLIISTPTDGLFGLFSTTAGPNRSALQR